MSIKLAVLFLFTVLLFGCQPQNEEKVVDFGYSYFWSGDGFYLVYQVDSTVHTGSSDVVHSFQIKEIHKEWFTDGENDAAMRIEQWKKGDGEDVWQPYKVSVQKRTITTGERVEDNLRWIKLVFPLEEGKEWNGYAYTTLGESEFFMSDVNRPFQVGGFAFDSTLKVVHYDTETFLSEKSRFEYYGKNVGLIHKKCVDISLQSGERRGSTVEMNIIEYGYE